LIDSVSSFSYLRHLRPS